MGSKASSQVIGYRYLMGLHMGLGRGPIDELVEIRVGDLRAWPQVVSDYKDIVGFGTYADMIAATPTFDVTATAEITSDGSNNGFYRRSGSTWIKLGDTLPSGGGQTTSGVFQIDNPKLFGGDDKEGGIQGPFHLLMGEPTQTCPSDLATLLEPEGKPVSGFRGVVSGWYNGLVCSMNPYPKAWAFRMRRALKGWYNDNCWYPERAIIVLTGYSGDGGDSTTTNDDYITSTIKAMNPAHIIVQAATDPSFGKGWDFSQLNLSSFRNCADTLYNEGFGLCFFWQRQEDIDVFVQTVCDTIGATVYIDRATGLLTMKLIRADYNPDELVLWTTENGLISIDDDEQSSSDGVFNEVVVSFTEPVTGKSPSVRAQNLANFDAVGGEIFSTTTAYPMIPTKQLAARVAQRDVTMQSLGLGKFNVRLNRKGWKIAPGSVFAVADPKRNISRVVLRAITVDDGQDSNGIITVKAAVDVFAMPTSTYITSQPSGWVAPPRNPLPMLISRVTEVTYRDIARNLSDADLATITDSEGFVISFGLRPNGLATRFEQWDIATGETAYTMQGAGSFCAGGKLQAAIGPYDTTLTLTQLVDLDNDDIGFALMIDNEILRVDAFDPATGVATVVRGCVDTIPAHHNINSNAFFYENDFAEDQRGYVNTEVISTKLRPATSSALLDLGSATAVSTTVGIRQARPYPPGNVVLNDGVTDYPVYSLDNTDIFTGDFDISWVGRDRIVQADQLVGHVAGNVGPETGVSYTIRVYNESNVLKRTDAAATSPWTYDSAMQAADGNPRLATFELVSVRDGLESYFPNRFSVARDTVSGWGRNWGNSWGKV